MKKDGFAVSNILNMRLRLRLIMEKDGVWMDRSMETEKSRS